MEEAAGHEEGDVFVIAEAACYLEKKLCGQVQEGCWCHCWCGGRLVWRDYRR